MLFRAVILEFSGEENGGQLYLLNFKVHLKLYFCSNADHNLVYYTNNFVTGVYILKGRKKLFGKLGKQ